MIQAIASAATADYSDAQMSAWRAESYQTLVRDNWRAESYQH
jgi:hypothetical protein